MSKKKASEQPVVSIGQINFEAYSKLRQGLDYRGEPIPGWEAVLPEIQEGWEAGALAVLKSIPVIEGAPDLDALSTLNNALDNLITEQSTRPALNRPYQIMINRLKDLIANYVHWVVEGGV